MKIGYIRRNDLELNPHLTEKFKFIESPCARRISSKGDRVYSKKFRPLDYEEIMDNAEWMKGNSRIILVDEPFLLDDELREKCVKWVEWANKASPEEYDPFAKAVE
jgi:hypothetical protein